ncbi:hypothetical protein niasHT_019797 [Heterodera trifolii]|uniref:Uncharacterized protein n=1 Tax=Heterodera trifolii TaxID=157864 RepID=A0ABD2LC64_9BILA
MEKGTGSKKGGKRYNQRNGKGNKKGGAILSPTDRPVVMVPLLLARHGPAPRSVPPNLAHNASKQTALSLMGTGEWETARGDEIDDGRGE